jgi:hypothetical protein
MKLTITEISIHRKSDSPIFGELNTKVKLQDEGGGMFVKISQDSEAGYSEIRLGFDELEYLNEAILILQKQETVQ